MADEKMGDGDESRSGDSGDGEDGGVCLRTLMTVAREGVPLLL